MKKVDKYFICNETNKSIYNEIIKPIMTSPKIEHALNLQQLNGARKNVSSSQPIKVVAQDSGFIFGLAL